MNQSDEALVDICNRGDRRSAEKAFGALYERHKDFVTKVAMRYVGDHDLALDVLQETFSYLLRKFPPTGDGLTLRARLTTLLYPVAKNSAISQLRKQHRFAANVDPDELPAAEHEPHSDFGGLLKDLSPERREVVALRFVDGMTMEEIAVALQIPAGTVKSRLHLAIKQLRDSPEIKKNHFS